MILLRLTIALIVGIVTYFFIKDVRQDMDKYDETSTSHSETEVWYDFYTVMD